VQIYLPQLRSLRRSWSESKVSQNPLTHHDELDNEAKTEGCEFVPGNSAFSARTKVSPSRSLLPVLVPSFKDNGIRWKYANQGAQTLPMPRKTYNLTKRTGLNLLESAITEAKVPGSRNEAFSRQLYIHALSYLIQALPSDLSNAEIICIDGALPHSLLGRTPNHPSPLQAHPQTPSPSLLHRFLASAIIQIFLLCQLLLPYVRYLLSTVYRYGRTHQVSEKIQRTSMKMGETLGRFWWDLIQVILKIPDRKLAIMLARIVLWWVQGISGGVHEGIGEGMSIIGVKRADFT
jgi:hypothetical protein